MINVVDKILYRDRTVSRTNALSTVSPITPPIKPIARVEKPSRLARTGSSVACSPCPVSNIATPIRSGATSDRVRIMCDDFSGNAARRDAPQEKISDVYYKEGNQNKKG